MLQAVGGGIQDGDTLTTGLTFPIAGLHILDTNATHDLIISPGSNLTADRTLTLTTGDANRTLDLGANLTIPADPNADAMLFWDDSAGATAWLTVDASLTITTTTIGVTAASDTVAGKIEIAIQSEMETGTDTTRAVVPGRQHYHQSACKAWCNFNGTGTIANRAAYNCDTPTDNGATGDYTINFTTDFSSASYGFALASGRGVAGGAAGFCSPTDADPVAGSMRINTYNATPAIADAEYVGGTFFGDQ